jgi:formyltetrahydrofolate deformylase
MNDPKSARSILLLSCKNQSGILKDISDFVAKRGGNIVSLRHLAERNDNQLFLRVKWIGANKNVCDVNNCSDFDNIRKKYQPDFCRVTCSTNVKTLGLFTSKTTHCLEKALYHYSEDDINTKILLIIGNSRNCEKMSKYYGIPFYFIPTDEPDYEKKQLELLKKHKVDFIGLARYMKILSPAFIAEYPNKIINIHHSFLPSFVGAKPYEEAYKKGVKLIGATSHFVIPELDQGPIIEQDVSRVKEGFDAENLAKQGRDVESEVFYFALRKYIEEKLIIYKNRVIVF